MFFFARDDRLFLGGSGTNLPPVNAQIKAAPHRVLGLKHNPYVGTFFNVKYTLEDPSNSSSILTESKNNPLVGVFRHSPSVISKRLGLKMGVMYNNCALTSVPVVSRLQSKDSTSLPLSRRNFVASLKQIPVSRYSSSSLGSRSTISLVDTPTSAAQNSAEPSNCHCNPTAESPVARSSNSADDSLPVCAICLEVYADGDEILTLACSHCFHSECASRWFFQHCLNSEDISSAFNCPQCRQDHISLSEAGSQPGSEPEGIPAQSFLSLGQTLIREGGYDFLSDVSSEAPMTTEVTQLDDDEAESLAWSDCSIPLYQLGLSPRRKK